MGRVLLTVGADSLFSRLDTTTNVGTDIVVLNPLPSYAKLGTSQITGVVVVTDSSGNVLTEVMGGEIGAASSVGSFSYGATGVVQLAFEKGRFDSVQEARDAVADYTIAFQLQETATYVPSAYDVKFYDRHSGAKTFDSIIIGDEQLLALMRSHISVADLSQRGMNPIRIEIFPQIRV